MRKLWWVALLAALTWACEPEQSTVRDAPEPEDSVATTVPSDAPKTTQEEKPVISVKPAAPKPVAASEVAGNYEMILSASQKEEIEKGLKSVREMAAKGDKEAKKMLPQLEAAVKASAEAAIELRDDGTYVARVSGSEAHGKFTVLGSEIRFDAPKDGSPAAYPVMNYDHENKKLLAHTGGTTVEFVRR